MHLFWQLHTHSHLVKIIRKLHVLTEVDEYWIVIKSNRWWFPFFLYNKRLRESVAKKPVFCDWGGETQVKPSTPYRICGRKSKIWSVNLRKRNGASTWRGLDKSSNTTLKTVKRTNGNMDGFGMFLDVVQSVQSSNNILPLVIFLNSWRESLSDTFTSISIGPTTMPLSKKCGDLSDLHERVNHLALRSCSQIWGMASFWWHKSRWRPGLWCCPNWSSKSK